MLQLLYAHQRGSVYDSKEFDIQRGVKQGDTLSAILFNCVLDLAFKKWKLRLTNEGLFTGFGLERLTNTRYADDILLYAKSLRELDIMTTYLIEELSHVGPQLNANKTRILHTEVQDEGFDLGYIDIADDFIQILEPHECHRYLGRRVTLSASNRVDIEFKYRKSQT